MGKDLSWYFIKEDIQMSNTWKDSQRSSSLGKSLHLLEQLKLKTLLIPSVVKDVEECKSQTTLVEM